MTPLPPLEPTGDDLLAISVPDLPQNVQAVVYAAYKLGRQQGRLDMLPAEQER